MGRHMHHRCAFKALLPTGYEKEGEDYLRGVTHCGSTSYFRAKEREAGAGLRASCPKCAAAAGKAKLASLGGRVTLSPAPENVASRFKSAYLVTIDGEPRGYVVAERGFGKGWELRRLPTARDLRFRTFGEEVGEGRPHNSWDMDQVPPERPLQPLHYSARDAMACGALRACEAGLLPTAAEHEAQEAEALARREAAERQRAAEAEESARLRAAREAEAAERRATAREGLAELGKRADLTNLELAGIAAALTIIGSE